MRQGHSQRQELKPGPGERTSTKARARANARTKQGWVKTRGQVRTTGGKGQGQDRNSMKGQGPLGQGPEVRRKSQGKPEPRACREGRQGPQNAKEMRHPGMAWKDKEDQLKPARNREGEGGPRLRQGLERRLHIFWHHQLKTMLEDVRKTFCQTSSRASKPFSIKFLGQVLAPSSIPGSPARLRVRGNRFLG
jgi:hypothetical protein